MNEKERIWLAELAMKERQNMVRLAACRLGSRDEAEDVVQDVLLRMQERCSTAFDTLEKMRNYAFRSLTNACTSRWRAAQRRPMESLSEQHDRQEENGLSLEAEYQRIATLLEALPQEQAEVIQLRFHGDCSFAEIAAILDLPLPTVKSRFLYGMRKMKLICVR